MKIKYIEENSIAAELEWLAGDDVIKINGNDINDIIDYRYYSSEEFLDIEINRAGEHLFFEIEKDFEENLGIEFEEIKYRCCGNKCIFCFVDQNPTGMRESIYVKDEDYRLSFIYGNYVTLTNVSQKQLNRVIEQRLSPLYVSVHSTDLNVRKLMLGIKSDDRLLEKIKFLTDNRIEIHAQIVLCPEINDGEYLTKTIDELSAFYPFLKSIAIVPVGLTGHRQNLYPIKSVTAGYAQNLIFDIDKIARNFKEKWDDYFVYLADEFYILADRELPDLERYEEFSQIENGVGMTRLLIDKFEEQMDQLPHRITQQRKLSMVTGRLAAPILKRYILPRLKQIENLEIFLHIIVNNFYGESATVSGLLTGRDIFEQLNSGRYGDTIVLPANCLNFDGLFLDNWTPEMLEKKLNTKIDISEDFISLIKNIL